MHFCMKNSTYQPFFVIDKMRQRANKTESINVSVENGFYLDALVFFFIRSILCAAILGIQYLCALHLITVYDDKSIELPMATTLSSEQTTWIYAYNFSMPCVHSVHCAHCAHWFMMFTMCSRLSKTNNLIIQWFSMVVGSQTASQCTENEKMLLMNKLKW